MESASSPLALVTAKLVQALIPSIVGSVSPSHQSSLQSLSMRVLGSRMTPSLDVDEFRLIQVIKMKISKSGDMDSAAKAVRMEELYNLLLSRPILNKRWSVLYLLYSLAMTKVSDTSQPHRYHMVNMFLPSLIFSPSFTSIKPHYRQNIKN